MTRHVQVQFSGEQGVDEGGVAREFFQLIVRDCFSANYGMFLTVAESRVFWFRASALSDLSDEFELIGAHPPPAPSVLTLLSSSVRPPRPILALVAVKTQS